jgi:hypothetical protein
MGHEISQFDISERQLLANSGRTGMWSDIGEAKITRTIFGRARVRVIRERDKIIRAWLLAALAAIAIAAAAWQAWIAYQQSELLTPLAPLSQRISVSAPVFQPETITPSGTRPPGRNKSESLIQTEIDSLVASPNKLPQRPPDLNPTKPLTAKPVAPQPIIASKPMPLATIQNSSKKQTDKQPISRVPNPIQPAAPAVATPPAGQPAAPSAATSPATQPAANSPVPVASPAEPLNKDDTSVQSSEAGSQTMDTDNKQPQVNLRGTPITIEQPQSTTQQ